MKIRVIAVGKLKEKYLKEGIAEYSKRLQGYCDFEIVEVSDERIPRRPTLAEEALIKAKEGRRILDHVKERDYMILLDVSSKQMDFLLQHRNEILIELKKYYTYVVLDLEVRGE